MAFQRTEKQKKATALLSSVRHAMLYGGSRSGKTFIATRSIFIRALKVPKTDHLITRQRLNHAVSSIWYQTIPNVIASCFPQIANQLYSGMNNKDLFIALPNESKIWLGGIDDKQRSEKVLGKEFSTIYANECSQISYPSISLLRTRLAQKSDLTNRFYYDCNPPTKSHWTYKVFLEHKDPNTGMPLLNPQDYAYLLMNPTDNIANVDKDYLQELASLPERERMRFMEGLFLDDIEGALFREFWIEQNRVPETSYEELKRNYRVIRTILGIDPAVTSKENSDLTGIVVVAECMVDGVIQYFVVADHSLIATPNEWATVARNSYRDYECQGIVVEVNQGGEMCKATLRNAGYTGMIYEVRASQSKFSRAEPIAGLYELGRVHHLSTGNLIKLENEIINYVPLLSDKSPDRMDALVWALHHMTNEESMVGRLFQSIDFSKIKVR